MGGREREREREKEREGGREGVGKRERERQGERERRNYFICLLGTNGKISFFTNCFRTLKHVTYKSNTTIILNVNFNAKFRKKVALILRLTTFHKFLHDTAHGDDLVEARVSLSTGGEAKGWRSRVKEK